MHCRLDLVPTLGTKRLEALSVTDVRRFLNAHAKQYTSATAKESHGVLRSALSAACREELISCNVAKIVEPVRVTSKSYEPRTIEEALIFLRAVRRDPMYAAIMPAIGLGCGAAKSPA